MTWRQHLHIRQNFVIICDYCNENIVERADESQITSRAKADKYAREHWETEHMTDPADRYRIEPADPEV
jgi:hypothetical protein